MTNNQPLFDLTEAHLKLLRELIYLWVDAGDNPVPMAYGYSPIWHDEDGNCPMSQSIATTIWCESWG